MAQGLYEVIGHSIVSGNSGGPMRKLWLEKLPGMFADAKICRSQSVSKARERGCPLWNKNKGPGTSPLQVRYDSTNCTVQSGGRPRPMWIKAPFLKGSVFKPLILKHMHEVADEESTAMSWTPK